MSNPWWQSAVIYQIYPRSFQDGNGDGVGDLSGIVERIPYLVNLGVDAIWLSPVFRSPMADFGYDVSDYTDIDPLFGTLVDFDRLLDKAHSSGLKVILDFVPNHTSDQHAWFLNSRSSRRSAKRDWYIWCDPAPNGGPPNNWLSEFGGSAWQFDRATGQYYYHAFLSAQPDLNWRNPEVRAAVYDAMRFWFERGVDGFRLDVIWHLIKDAELRNNPINPDFKTGDPPHQAVIPLYTADRPEVHDIIAEIRAVADNYPDRLLIGEIYLPLERLMAYYGKDVSGLHLPFNFSLISTSWNAAALAKLIADYESALPPHGWPNWVLGNHDQPRLASRAGQAKARLAAMLLLTLRGTPTVYYGDEIGMEQAQIPPDRIRDPVERNVPGKGLGRDGCRTPMQWDDSPHAGFTSAEPWLPLQETWRENNVTAALSDPNSLLNLHRALIRLRHCHPVLVTGGYRSIVAEEGILLFIRTLDNTSMLIALNFDDQPAVVMPKADWPAGAIRLSSYLDRYDERMADGINLRPLEGVVVEFQ